MIPLLPIAIVTGMILLNRRKPAQEFIPQKPLSTAPKTRQEVADERTVATYVRQQKKVVGGSAQAPILNPRIRTVTLPGAYSWEKWKDYITTFSPTIPISRANYEAYMERFYEGDLKPGDPR